MLANAISVRTLGSSGVVVLSLLDPNPRVAVRLANAVADAVVSTRLAIVENGVATSLRELLREEASTNTKIGKLNARVQQLAALIAATSPGGAGQNPAITQVDELQARLTSLQDLATQLTVQRAGLAAQLGPKTTVLDKAVSAARVHGRGPIDALLGGVIGLVVGIAAAAMREMMRPSLVGAAAISRAIGVPLLGEMSTVPDDWTLAALPDAGIYVELAADAQHVDEVRFAALEPGGRLRARIRMLEGPLQRLRFRRPPAGELPAAAAHGLQSEPAASATALSADVPDGGGSPRIGLVVAIPSVLRVADVDALTNFVWISGWIALGVMVYSSPRKPITRVRRGARSAESARDDSADKQLEVKA